MKQKVIVLLSAGLDSSTNLYWAAQKDQVVQALTFNYGQRAADKEMACAAKLAAHLKIPHKIISVPFFKDFGGSSLITDKVKIPTGKDVDINSLTQSTETAKAVWVPNRNGIFLNIAAGFAESLGADAIIPGFNKEEATTFPDNSLAFMQAMEKSLDFSTANHVKVKCYTHELDKTQIVREAIKLQVPFQDMWPCYQALEKWCGECESCLRSQRALTQAGVSISNLFLKP